MVQSAVTSPSQNPDPSLDSTVVKYSAPKHTALQVPASSNPVHGAGHTVSNPSRWTPEQKLGP